MIYVSQRFNVKVLQNRIDFEKNQRVSKVPLEFALCVNNSINGFFLNAVYLDILTDC